MHNVDRQDYRAELLERVQNLKANGWVLSFCDLWPDCPNMSEATCAVCSEGGPFLAWLSVK